MKNGILLAALVVITATSPVMAQTVGVGTIECVPLEGHAVATASVSPPDGTASTMRLFFRRVNSERLDFYYVEMRPAGGGNYWAVLPDPDASMIKDQHEPVEYYAAAYDGLSGLVSKSEVKTAPVTKQCRVALTPQQAGYAENLTVGETANWQRGERLFHWECDGVVTRIDLALVPRADETCRSCLIAWWKPAALIGAGAVTGIIIDTNEPTPVSPSFP